MSDTAIGAADCSADPYDSKPYPRCKPVDADIFAGVYLGRTDTFGISAFRAAIDDAEAKLYAMRKPIQNLRVRLINHGLAGFELHAVADYAQSKGVQ